MIDVRMVLVRSPRPERLRAHLVPTWELRAPRPFVESRCGLFALGSQWGEDVDHPLCKNCRKVYRANEGSDV